MTVPQRPGDSGRGVVFHPPDAVLYVQLAPRRRAVSALIVGSGFALAAALFAYGVMTQKAWPMEAAIVCAFLGPALAWMYQDRVRPAQIIEERARATALFDTFDGRFDLGRLALTHAGVELNGESFPWPTIHTLESTLADAKLKRVMLVLGAAHAGRRIPLSLADLPEAPGVVYAVMKMLWMRQVTARNVASFLPGMKVNPSDLTPAGSTMGRFWTAIALVAGLAGTALSIKLLTGPQPWFAALSAVSAMAMIFLGVSLSSKANWREAARRQERASELETSTPAGEDFVVRRRRVTRWPTIITLLFIAPSVIFFAMGDGPFAASFLPFGTIVSLIAWIVAWLMGAGVIATLTTTGIVMRGREISWHDIASLDLHFLPRIGTGQLVIRLVRPREPRTLGERISSSLSGGRSDREIGVSLARSKEPAGAVLHLAAMRWERAVGSRRVDDALIRQVKESASEARTWRQSSATEKAQRLWVAAGMAALLIFGFHGVHADVRTSNAWLAVSLVVSAILAVWSCIALLRSRVFLRARYQGGLPNYIVLFFLLGVVIGGMLWFAIGQSLPDLATRAWGREVTREVAYAKSRYRNRKLCAFPLALRLDEIRPYRFCTSAAFHASLPPAGTLRLELRESWFGAHIVSVSTVED